MIKLKNKTEKTTGRRCREDSPEVMKAMAKEGDLRERLKEVAAEEAGIAKQLSSAAATSTAKAAEDVRVAQLLRGELDSAPVQNDPRRKTVTRLRQVQNEIRALQAAIKVQSDRVRAVTVTASVEICCTLEPEYRALVQDVINRWAGLIAAFTAEEAFRANLKADGILATSLPMVYVTDALKRDVGSLRHPNGALAGMLTDAKRLGYRIPDPS